MKLSKGFKISDKIIVFIFKQLLKLFFSSKTISQIFSNLVTDKANSYLYYVDLVRFYNTKRDLLNKKEVLELLKKIEKFEKTFLDEDVESQNCFFFFKDKTNDFRIVTLQEMIDIYVLNMKRFVFLANFSDTLREEIFQSMDIEAIEVKKRENTHLNVMDFIMSSLKLKSRKKKDWLYYYHFKISEQIKIYESIKKENLNKPSNFFND